MRPLTEAEREALLRVARAYRERAYAPYSGFRVGAAVLGGSGRIYGGCNVENAAYPASRCAEQTAVQRAVSEGEREIVAVAVVGSGTAVCVPCGVCRQILSEFGPEMHVIMAGADGVPESVGLADLLPRAFRLQRP